MYTELVFTPPFPPCLLTRFIINKMINNKIGKNEIVNVLISLGATAIAYLAVNYLNPPIENLFYPVIFILLLIYLELLNKSK